MLPFNRRRPTRFTLPSRSRLDFHLNLQSNEQELKTQRMMLSPRALQQGWKEELDSNIGQHKEWITKRKLEAVFDAGLPARELEEEVISAVVQGGAGGRT